jgi:hypothetical protein
MLSVSLFIFSRGGSSLSFFNPPPRLSFNSRVFECAHLFQCRFNSRVSISHSVAAAQLERTFNSTRLAWKQLVHEAPFARQPRSVRASPPPRFTRCGQSAAAVCHGHCFASVALPLRS